MKYEKPIAGWWTGRTSEQRDYLYQHIRLLDLQDQKTGVQDQRSPALLGYSCDIGVHRNQGRVGAAGGPNAIRTALGKLPALSGGPALWTDAGNLLPAPDMESAQRGFAKSVSQLLRLGYFPIGLGGGHDMAFAHFQGLVDFLPAGTRLGMVNFDAHFDLRRPLPLPHSGSPYFQMAEACKEHAMPFRYACIGARPDANTQELWDRAREWEVLVVERAQMGGTYQKDVIRKLRAFCEGLDALYISIDLDGFSSAFAPGVSAASPMGYAPEDLLPLLGWLLDSGKVISMDLAECNPGLDRDGQTARLAASLIHFSAHRPGLF